MSSVTDMRDRPSGAGTGGVPMTGGEMVALFERCGVPRAEITAGMMLAGEFSIKAERMACANFVHDRLGADGHGVAQMIRDGKHVG